MTEADYNELKHRSVFDRDYKGRKLLLNPTILQNTKASIVNLMDNIITALNSAGQPVEILCLWEDSGHTSKSQHYIGQACDFHFIKQTLKYHEQIKLVMSILDDLKVSHAVGFGFYPKSNSWSLHVDTRGDNARWCGVFNYKPDGTYTVDYDAMSFEEGLKYLEG